MTIEDERPDPDGGSLDGQRRMTDVDTDDKHDRRHY